MPNVMVVGSESGIGSLRKIEEVEQGAMKRGQVGGSAVA